MRGLGLGLGLMPLVARRGSGGGGGDAFAWSEFVAHADTVKFYVSDSDGNDSNDGLSESTPKKTIAAAAALLRNNKPDWLLLKRGDTFAERLGWFVESINGYSSTYPVVFSYYGNTADPRPKIDAGAVLGISCNLNHVSHVAIVGIHFTCSTHATDDVDGITCHSVTDLLIEDCCFNDLKSAIVCQNTFGAGRPGNIRVRRSQIFDIYVSTGGGIGVFHDETDDIIYDECLIDYCGWNAAAGAAPGGFFHNTYFQHTCGPITVRRCISTRSSLEGINARPGGWITQNFIAGSPIGIGYSSGTSGYDFASNPGSCSQNVFTEPWESFGGLYWGFAFATAHYFDCSENIAQNNDLPLNDDFSFDWSGGAGPYGDVGCTHITIGDNIAYKCRAPFRLRNNTGTDLTDIAVTGNDIQEDPTFNATNTWGDPICLGLMHRNAFPGTVTFGGNSWFTGRAAGQWFNDGFGGLSSFAAYMATLGDTTSTSGAKVYSDPGRTVEDYMASIGETGGLVEFCAGARLNRRYAWDDRFTAVAIINFIRAGYDLAPLA